MITRLKITNYKSIKELDLELKPINVLIGANGVGKSNFISFFKLMNRIYEQRLQEYIGNNFNALLHFGRAESNYISGLIFFNKINSSNKNAIEVILKPITNANSGYISKLVDYYNRGWQDENTVNNWHSAVWDVNEQESSLKDFMGDWRAIHVMNYLKSFKIYHFHNTGENAPLRQSCELNDNRFLRENGQNLPAYLYYLQQIHPKNFKKIEMQMRAIAPFFNRFDLEPDRLNPSQIELRWQERGNDYSFNGHYLSDGSLRFMALATLLLQPNLPEVILIDEPELGLHPSAIHRLAGLFQKASAKSQIIISTQSTTLVDCFEPEDIITVDRKNRCSVFHRQSKENLQDWLENYTMADLWNKNVIGGRP